MGSFPRGKPVGIQHERLSNLDHVKIGTGTPVNTRPRIVLQGNEVALIHRPFCIRADPVSGFVAPGRAVDHSENASARRRFHGKDGCLPRRSVGSLPPQPSDLSSIRQPPEHDDVFISKMRDQTIFGSWR